MRPPVRYHSDARHDARTVRELTNIAHLKAKNLATPVSHVSGCQDARSCAMGGWCTLLDRRLCRNCGSWPPPQLTFELLKEHLKQSKYKRGGGINWKELGDDCGVYWRTAPHTSFMCVKAMVLLPHARASALTPGVCVGLCRRRWRRRWLVVHARLQARPVGRAASEESTAEACA